MGMPRRDGALFCRIAVRLSVAYQLVQTASGPLQLGTAAALLVSRNAAIYLREHPCSVQAASSWRRGQQSHSGALRVCPPHTHRCHRAPYTCVCVCY